MWLLILGIILLVIGSALHSYCAVGKRNPLAAPQILSSSGGIFLQIGWIVLFVAGTIMLFFVHWLVGIAAIIAFWFIFPMLMVPIMRRWMLG